MKLFRLIIVFIFLTNLCFGKEVDVSKLVDKLHEALVQKDTNTLKGLIHDNVIYGHSNGWTEFKHTIIENLYNGTLTYNRIELETVESGTKGIVRFTGVQVTSGDKKGRVKTLKNEYDYSIVYKGQPMTLKLSVLFVWIKENGRWQLLARQSTKI